MFIQFGKKTNQLLLDDRRAAAAVAGHPHSTFSPLHSACTVAQGKLHLEHLSPPLRRRLLISPPVPAAAAVDALLAVVVQANCILLAAECIQMHFQTHGGGSTLRVAPPRAAWAARFGGWTTSASGALAGLTGLLAAAVMIKLSSSLPKKSVFRDCKFILPSTAGGESESCGSGGGS